MWRTVENAIDVISLMHPQQLLTRGTGCLDAVEQGEWLVTEFVQDRLQALRGFRMAGARVVFQAGGVRIQAQHGKGSGRRFLAPLVLPHHFAMPAAASQDASDHE